MHTPPQNDRWTGAARCAPTILAFALLVAGCTDLRFPNGLERRERDWATEGGAETRANAAPDLRGTAFRQAWRYNAEAAFGPGSAVVTDGYVLLATRKGELHAVTLAKGRREGRIELGAAFEATPALGGPGLIAALGRGRRSIIGFNLRTGKTEWRAGAEAVEGAPLVVGDVAVVVGAVRGSVLGLDARTGTERWRRDAHAAVRASPVLTPGGVAVADVRGMVLIVDPATGNVRREFSAGAPVYSTPAVAGGRLIVPTTRGRVATFDAATGTPGWTLTLPDVTVRFAPPAADGDALVLAATDGTVRLVDPATGVERWRVDLPEAVTAAPLITPDVVIVGTHRRRLLALDRATGEIRWETTLDGRIKSAFAAHAGGFVVLAEPRFAYHFVPTTNETASR